MTKPLLFRRATDRTTHADLPGGYDPSAALWTIGDDRGTSPIVTAAGADALEILTKTRVRQEVDDEKFSLLEITTKTAVNQEGDDQKSTAGLLLEIVTKTDVQQEGDDQIGQPGMDVV